MLPCPGCWWDLGDGLLHSFCAVLDRWAGWEPPSEVSPSLPALLRALWQQCGRWKHSWDAEVEGMLLMRGASPAQPSQLTNGSELWKGSQAWAKNGFSAASKNAAVTQPCSSGPSKVWGLHASAVSKAIQSRPQMSHCPSPLCSTSWAGQPMLWNTHRSFISRQIWANCDSKGASWAPGLDPVPL